MIYVSSACVRHKKIRDSVKELVTHGFKNIELSGGTTYYDGLFDDLLELKEKYQLNYICHNYFPPPEKHFVVNLASLDNDIFINTFNHLENAINLTRQLGVKMFGFHAGFYYNIPLEQIGKEVFKQSLFDKEKAMIQFCTAFNSLKKKHPDIDLYIENNVLSHKNYSNFGDNLFMLTTCDEYFAMSKKIDFKLILDIAHLKVTCNSLNLDFDQEFDVLFNCSEYIHLSDNNGLIDQNKALLKTSDLYSTLSKYSFKNKIITLEVYGSINEVRRTYNLISNL
tara:strand:+ start:125 stop:967 length:843 start_codon:yes stop_codon:yes gene_type:complete